MQDFTAVDFKVVKGYRKCSYQIGLDRVEKFELKFELNLLMQPPAKYNQHNHLDLHNLSFESKSSLLSFDDIWHKIEPFIKNQTVIAYDGLAFEFPVICSAFKFYDVSKMFHREGIAEVIIHQDDKLLSLCKEYHIPVNWYDALSVARACAALYGIYLYKNKWQIL